MGAEGIADLLRILTGDETEGELGMRLGRNRRLEARFRIAAPDAVDIASRPCPYLLEHASVRFAGRDFQADIFEKGFAVEGQARPYLFDLFRQLGDAVIKSLDRDAAVRCAQR